MLAAEPSPVVCADAAVPSGLLSRSALEALVEIAEAATSALDLDELLRAVVQRVAKAVPVDRCSAVLLDGATEQAVVVTSHDVPQLRRLPIDLRRYPELRQAFDSRSTVVVDDVQTDPLLEEVRPMLRGLPISSLVVVPLVAHDDAYGAIFLRFARRHAFAPEEQAFLRTIASAIANSVRNAQLYRAVDDKRAALERAYAERYRDLERLNDQLLAANRVKEQLLEICSHDIRSPIQIILWQAKLLGNGLSEPQRERTGAIERQGRRILELVERVMERGRNRLEVWQLEAGPLQLETLCHQIVADLSVVAAEQSVELKTHLATGLGVSADPNALRQVLENLLSNALKHSPAGMAVELQARRDEVRDLVRVEVHDRGPGIAAEDLPLVFERYRRSAGSRGLGLGLAICRDIIAAHGGAIWAQARDGGGTSMVFTLPALRGD